MASRQELQRRSFTETSERYIGKYCQFQPASWATIGDIKYPIGFKVVTEDLKSLGLRKNPNILFFTEGDWTILPDDQIEPGNLNWRGWGGIWSAVHLSGAQKLQRYYQTKYDRQARCFIAGLMLPLYVNSYRIKSAGVYLLEEIK